LCLRETRRLLQDRGEAEDAAQEAVVRAWKSTARGDPITAPDAWLRTIAGNEARRMWGKRSRAAPAGDLIEEDAVGASSGPEEWLGGIACEQMLAPLPCADRELVRQRFVDDLSYAEIAASAGIPEATAKTRIHRSLARLRTLLSNEALG
jgi:RNA polymerase sigma-70 factor (ECF subfamily)